MKNYYKILGVKKSATDDELKRAYRKLALEYHPDRHGGDDSQFKEVSEAYAVLKDPAKRAEHNLDLKKEELKQKPRTAPTHTTTSSSDFGGKTDPNSQQGVWDDVQSNDQDGYRYRYTPTSTPQYVKNFAQWARPVAITLIAMAVVIVVGSYIFRSLAGGSGGVPTITPLTNNGNNSQGYIPPTTGIGSTTPTPSATPNCPTGQPSINVASVTDDKTTDGQGREGYTIAGTLTNDTTATINVNNVGFYFYSVSYDKTQPPDATDTFANMVTTGSLPVPPGVSVNWSSNQYVPTTGSKVAVSIAYPSGVGDQVTPQWYYSGNIAQNCEPSSNSAQSF